MEAYLDVLVRLVGREGAAVAQQIDEAYGDAAVNVQDELRDDNALVIEGQKKGDNARYPSSQL
jgi:hypothetical protein